MKSFDLAIIGGGGAAFAAAAKANELGIKTVMINKGLPMGGTCVNVGCIPSKFLLEAGSDLWRENHPRFKSITAVKNNLSFQDVIIEKKEVVLRNRQSKYSDVLKNYKNVEVIEARARFEGPGRIRAGDETIEAKFTLIATGSSGRKLNIAGMEELDSNDVLTNIEAFELKNLPKSMIVIGGGPTGLEVAQIFHRFGTKVSLVEGKDRVFSVTEPEISEVIAENFRQEGISIRTGVKVLSVRKEDNELVLSINAEGAEDELRAEKIFVSVGVQGNTKDLNLEAIGLEANEKGFIDVDDQMRTHIPNVFAAGDVTGSPWLETVAAREGAMAVAAAFDAPALKINYDAVPAAVFIEPQVAIVGLTEAELMKRIGKCVCRTVPLQFVPKADITNETNGAAKMVVNPDTKEIVGFHLVAPHAAEIIHEAALAIQHGLKIQDIIDLVHVFPSYSEVVKITAQAFVRDVQHMSCCVE